MTITSTIPTIERFAENETRDLARQDARLIKRGKSAGHLTPENVAFALRQRGYGDDESLSAAIAAIAKARDGRQAAKAPCTTPPAATVSRQHHPASRHGHEGMWCRHCSGPVADGRGDCRECR